MPFGEPIIESRRILAMYRLCTICLEPIAIDLGELLVDEQGLAYHERCAEKLYGSTKADA